MPTSVSATLRERMRIDVSTSEPLQSLYLTGLRSLTGGTVPVTVLSTVPNEQGTEWAFEISV